MGTLFNQPARKWLTIDDKEITTFLERVKTISKKSKLSTDQVLKGFEILELERRNNLKVINSDIKDEQLAGFGDLFKELNQNIEGLSDQLKELVDRS